MSRKRKPNRGNPRASRDSARATDPKTPGQPHRQSNTQPNKPPQVFIVTDSTTIDRQSLEPIPARTKDEGVYRVKGLKIFDPENDNDQSCLELREVFAREMRMITGEFYPDPETVFFEHENFKVQLIHNIKAKLPAVARTLQDAIEEFFRNRLASYDTPEDFDTWDKVNLDSFFADQRLVQIVESDFRIIYDDRIKDEKSYDEAGEFTETPNEIPDLFENSRQAQFENYFVKEKYRFLVYDIKAGYEASDGPFPFKQADDLQIENELRWMYFTVSNFDGWPDVDAGISDQTVKYYRTNFFEAKPDPDSNDVFYISHRGPALEGRSPYSNDIIKVSIIGSVLPAKSGDPVPPTSSFFKFERAYGFKVSAGGSPAANYLGDFEVTRTLGQKMIITNNFRDLAMFQGLGGHRYSIGAATLDGSSWFEELVSTRSRESFYQVACGKNGKVLTASYYGNEVILLDVTPWAGIKEVNRIK